MGTPPGAGGPGGPAGPDRLTRYREKLLENLVFLLPGVVLAAVGAYLSRVLFDQPWRAVFLLGPVALAAAVLWYRAARRSGPGGVTIGRPFRVFLAVYLLAFGVAAGSSLFDWKRTLAGFGDTVPRNWLALNRLGDWRYLVIARRPTRTDLVVLTTSAPLGLEAGRADVAQLIGVAAANDALGIAFDYYFTEPSSLDPWLCGKVRAAGIPVLAGYGFTVDTATGEVDRLDYPRSLESCIPLDSAQGHLMGYREADNRIRSIPVLFANLDGKPALSWRIAERLLPPDRRGALPRTGLLRFLPTAEPIRTYPVDELFRDTSGVRRLRDRFVLVGEGAGSADTVPTPFGTLPGVVVHALATQALLDGRFIHEAPWWASLLFLLVACYVVTVSVSRGDRMGQVLLVAILLSLAMLLAAAAAARFWLMWVEVSYALVGTWLLTLLTLLIRRSTAGQGRRSPAS
jgi:hypothetical protein